MSAETRRKSKVIPWSVIEPWAAPLLIIIAVMLFYAIPIVSDNATIHWDAVDVQLPLQRYFSNHLLSGQLPYWTPYLLSGYPLMANPEMAAWYLPNWPFYLMHVNFLAIQFELVLNAVIACLGAWLFFRTAVCRSSGAILGAFAYGLSGFFAGHSSHVTVFATAAWLPWLLWAYRRAVDRRLLSGVALGGIAGGVMILAGYLPGALFSFAALACYALACIAANPRRWQRLAGAAAAIAVLSLALSSMQLLPALELIHHSHAVVDYSGQTLQPRSLMTLLLPDAIGSISMKDTGMITDHYFYAGLFLLPLAVMGLLVPRARYGLALIVPAVWYMLGPSALFYRLGGVFPGIQSLGPPDMAWFVAAFGLAWLAASGCHSLSHRLPYLGMLVVALFFTDLWYWNLYRNPLAYERANASRYSEEGARLIAKPQFALTRFDSAGPIRGVGPLLFPLDLKFETTTGYLVLVPEHYHEYAAAKARNPLLRGGLNVGRYVDHSTGRIEVYAAMLPRAYFPRSVAGVSSEAESLQALEKLDPNERSTVLAPNYILPQDPQAEYFIQGFDEQSYGIHYRAALPSLLKLSVPWYPGWQARLAGRKLPILRVDHALMGVIVPPGEGVVQFEFRSTWFGTGVIVFIVTLIGLALLLWGEDLWARITMKSV